MSDPIAYQIYGTEAKRGGANAEEKDLHVLRKARTFERALVVETLCDPSQRENPPETLFSSKQLEKYYRAPRNSIVCRIFTNEDQKDGNSDIISYPLFSSHFSLPVKPGEEVWIMRENIISDSKDQISFWISRINDVLEHEDTNFTAYDRTSSTYLTSSVQPGSSRILKFDADDGQTFDFSISEFMQNGPESKQIILEPVPRLTKRPGDLTLQGSNNTAIILGTDRGFDFQTRPDGKNKLSNASQKVEKKSGAIDVVVGRGRYFAAEDSEISKSRKKDNAGGSKNSTQPFVVKNELGFETDKDPAQTQDRKIDEANGADGAPADLGNYKTNPVEGDPDFLVDASRVYVSEKSDIDKKLGLDQIKAKGFAAQFEPVSPAPCIAVKSDHVRIVARKVPLKAVDGKLPDGFNEANGTIRIVKEGKPDEDLACIYIEADGTIQISGKQIYLGRQKDDGGAGNGPADGEAQPYIKYKELEELWGKTMDELNKFCDSLLTHVTPGYGSPSPQINKAAQDLKAAIESNLKPDIETVKSERIFGE